MRATLIYPPAVDPRAPQLALPSLAAVLRPAGVETTLLDLNLTGVEFLLRPDRLVEAARRVKATHRPAFDDPRGRLAIMADEIAERAPLALNVLRDERFYDAVDYNAARDLLTSALELSTAAAPTAVQYNVAPIRYDVPGVDAAVLADLIRVTGDRAANLFADHWEAELYPALERERPELVGITITNRQQILPGLMLARELRARGHFVVLGGAVYTKFQQALAERPEFFRHFADGVVVYEGETAILELCHQLEHGRRFERVPNYLYLQGDTVQVTPSHAENVERLPTPDFQGLPLDRYLAPAPVLPILTGKGCYFNRCKFCDIPYINHIAPKAYRTRSPERIVEDVRTLSRRFGARHFVITDEALSPRLLVKLADAFAPHRDERYRFTGYARLEPGFTPEVASKMAELGVQKVFFGLESASQKTQDHMEKGTRVAEAPPVLGAMRDAGIDFHLFSIVGFPEETEADAEETYRFFVDHQALIDAPGNTFDIHPFGLELRTDYWTERERYGIEVDAGRLAKDFLIGLRSSDWRNLRGLTHERAMQLIYGEYLPRLRRRYRRWHNTLTQLRPGFEEYSVLYGDRWRGREFPFATTLPERRDPRRFRLRVSPAWSARTDGDTVLWVGRDGAFTIDAITARAISLDEARTVDGWLGPQVEPALEATARERLDALFEAGVLQLRFIDEDPDVRAGA